MNFSCKAFFAFAMPFYRLSEQEVREKDALLKSNKRRINARGELQAAAPPTSSSAAPSVMHAPDIVALITQLSSHAQVLTLEVTQIEQDLKQLALINQRYEHRHLLPSRTAPNANTNNATNTAADSSRTDYSFAEAPAAAAAGQQPGAPAPQTQTTNSAHRTAAAVSGRDGGNGVTTTLVGGGSGGVSSCFAGQIRQLEDLKSKKSLMLNDIRQHLMLYQLHAPSGAKLLAKIQRTMGTAKGPL